MESAPWYATESAAEIPSPALLVYPGRVRHNIAETLRIAGNADRLRPHIKTHKTAEIIRMQLEAGITRFKCATVAEAELLARCGAPDILLAYQPVGPDIDRMLDLQEAYPALRFGALTDHAGTAGEIGERAAARPARFRLFLDLNVGMDRTGIPAGNEAADLYRFISGHPALEVGGFHAYDGHIRDSDFAQRKAASDAAYAPVSRLREELEAEGLPVPEVITGGSPTFPVHALRSGVRLSPGTTVFWDANYATRFPDIPLLPAAALLCRVVSRPAPGKICLDLGHKAVAPEMPFPRVSIPGLEGWTQTGQSEEHLVLEKPGETGPPPGTVVYAIPMHICPTVCKYPRLLTIENGKLTGSWEVAARDYRLSI